MQRTPARRIQGRLAGLYRAVGQDFVSEAVDALDLTFEGIEGDVHGGTTRRSGGREPWYRRGTLMRNERQLSLLARTNCSSPPMRSAFPRSGRNGSAATC